MMKEHDDVDGALWAEAASYMREHGDSWSARAMAEFRALIARDDLIASEHWAAVVDRMIRLAEAPRQ